MDFHITRNYQIVTKFKANRKWSLLNIYAKKIRMVVIENKVSVAPIWEEEQLR